METEGFELGAMCGDRLDRDIGDFFTASEVEECEQWTIRSDVNKYLIGEVSDESKVEFRELGTQCDDGLDRSVCNVETEEEVELCEHCCDSRQELCGMPKKTLQNVVRDHSLFFDLRQVQRITGDEYPYVDTMESPARRSKACSISEHEVGDECTVQNLNIQKSPFPVLAPPIIVPRCVGC